MVKDCKICRGEGMVRLPVYDPVYVSYDGNTKPPDIPKGWRDYPCPECADYAPYDRFYVCHKTDSYDVRIDDEKYRAAVREDLAHRLVHHLLERNLIKFDDGRSTIKGTRSLTGTICVVSPKTVATMDGRIREK